MNITDLVTVIMNLLGYGAPLLGAGPRLSEPAQAWCRKTADALRGVAPNARVARELVVVLATEKLRHDAESLA